MKQVIIHLISDSSGQTVRNAAKSALSQFDQIEAKEYNWPMIRTQKLLEEVLEKIKAKPGAVLYTISSQELRENLKAFCMRLNVPCISVVGKIIKEMSAFYGIGAGDDINFTNKFDESYFDKVEAIDYTLRHDDGQMINELKDADIILIGPSRTSKTPTSVYLAYNGFKTANVPYIYGCEFPQDIDKIAQYSLIVGLVINPNRLIEIRETRMHSLQINSSTNYTDHKVVQDECLQVKRICEQKKWPIIDVSRRSIEETAAVIMKIYYDYKSKNNINKNVNLNDLSRYYR